MCHPTNLNGRNPLNLQIMRIHSPSQTSMQLSRQACFSTAMLTNAADPDLCKDDGDVAIFVAIPAGRIRMGRVMRKLSLEAHTFS